MGQAQTPRLRMIVNSDSNYQIAVKKGKESGFTFSNVYEIYKKTSNGHVLNGFGYSSLTEDRKFQFSISCNDENSDWMKNHHQEIINCAAGLFRAFLKNQKN
jgi:hypothetical protein